MEVTWFPETFSFDDHLLDCVPRPKRSRVTSSDRRSDSPDFRNGLDVSDSGSITRAPSRHLLRADREYFWNTRAAFTRRDFVESPRSRMLESRCPSIEVANAADGNRGSIR